MKSKRVVVWGVGRRWEAFKGTHAIRQLNIVAFVDVDTKKQGTVISNTMVYGPDEITKLVYDYVLVLPKENKTILDALDMLGVPSDRVWTWEQYRLDASKNVDYPIISVVGAMDDLSEYKKEILAKTIVKYELNEASETALKLQIENGEVDYVVYLDEKLIGGESDSKIITLERLIMMQRDIFIPQERIVNEEYNPFVSIIVPNYNHEKFLGTRLDTIYYQTYKNYEVLLLDDCSTDNSREVLKRYAAAHKENTRMLFNKKRAGKAFLQWEKGIKNAKGELIWIAESDDYSSPFFLEKMVEEFRKQSVMLAFSHNVFVKNGAKVWSQEEYLCNTPINWLESFSMPTAHLVKLGFSRFNIIPNVSSCMFRNVGISSLVHKAWKELDLCGDWLFYLDIARGGSVTYRSDVDNYYRIHDASTSLNVQKQAKYYEEQAFISKYLLSHYKLSKAFLYEVQSYLLQHYKDTTGKEGNEFVKKYYSIEEILKSKKNVCNIGMVTFGMINGGGETFPIYLANKMKELGYSITFIDTNLSNQYNDEIRRKLLPSIPLVELQNIGDFKSIVKAYDLSVVHSHHGSVDSEIAVLNQDKSLGAEHVITLHGMYETMEIDNAKRVIGEVIDESKKLVYIADKNLVPFEREKVTEKYKDKFVKMPNGLPRIPVCPISRDSLGIAEDDFVVCLVSRAMEEKGWFEAIEAVEIANKSAELKNKIHLILVGDGDIREECKKKENDTIHVVGLKDNVRDYFAMADLGLLPTKFKGESFPLTVIECLMSGTPMLATDIAEVRNELTASQNEMAGDLISLNNWSVDPKEIASKILKFALDNTYYEKARCAVPKAAEKMDISIIAEKYISIYKE